MPDARDASGVPHMTMPHLSQTCWCASCDIEAVKTLPVGDLRRLSFRMNLCPDCGDKRCLRAGFHGCSCSSPRRGE